VIRQQLGHLRLNLASIDALAACGASSSAAGRYAYQKLLVVSELVRQQTILDHSPGFRKRTSTALHALASETPTAKSKAHSHTEFGEAGP